MFSEDYTSSKHSLHRVNQKISGQIQLHTVFIQAETLSVWNNPEHFQTSALCSVCTSSKHCLHRTTQNTSRPQLCI